MTGSRGRAGCHIRLERSALAQKDRECVSQKLGSHDPTVEQFDPAQTTRSNMFVMS